MPRKKESFIDKKNAVTYALMARPGAEEDAASDERGDLSSLASGGGGGGGGSVLSGRGGSERGGAQVWMRKDNNHRARDPMEALPDDGSVFNDAIVEARSRASDATSAYSMYSDVTFVMGPNGPVPRRERLSREKRRELRELGFDPNDGYDYTRHLRLTGEGGGTIFVPTKKDHVKGVSRGEGGGEGHAQNERAGAQSAVTAGGSGKRGKDDQDVFLREDVERLGDLAQPIGVDQKPIETVAAAIEEEQRWTHERVKAITDEMTYVAKDAVDASMNAIAARALPRAPDKGVAATELKDMIEVMEHAEQATDDALAKLEEFGDGGLGDLQDDFILQAMGGSGGEGGDYGVSAAPRTFPPIRLRYDEAEVENELATLEEIVEEEALEEEEAELANGPAWFRGGGGMFGGRHRGGDDGSDAGTDRDIDEEDWWGPDDDDDDDDDDGRRGLPRRDGLGAKARDVDDAFEAMAGGYDSDEIGELDEDDPRIFGHAEIDRFEGVLDEFRKQQGTERYRAAAEVIERRGSEEGADGAEGAEGADHDDDDDDDAFLAGFRRGRRRETIPDEPTITREDADDAARAMITTRRRAGLPLPEHLMREMTLGDGGDGADDEHARRYEIEDPDARDEEPPNEYLAEKTSRQDKDWDCESVVSTYSNLDHHPAMIDDFGVPPGGKKKRAGKGGTGRGYNPDDVGPGVIKLSATNGLPVDYVMSRRGKGRGGSMLTADNLAIITEGDDRGGGGEGGPGSDDDSEGEWEEYDEDGDDGEGDGEGGAAFGEEWRQNIRRKGETPEEKRARKAAVKAGRRDARAAKKGLKQTFKQEEREMGKKQGAGDVRAGLSVRPLA